MKDCDLAKLVLWSIKKINQIKKRIFKNLISILISNDFDCNRINLFTK